MTTPVWDFIRQYAAGDAVRLHMPGHKGALFTGCEPYDITEIDGADDLYHPRGIIRESQENAAALFGSGQTVYATEGSSQCIRAMLHLALLAFWEKSPGRRPVIIAGRNVHKAFLTAAALLDFDIAWVFPQGPYSLCRCEVSPRRLALMLEKTPDVAGVYLTSPDYLGHCGDIAGCAAVAHGFGVPLLVDNAHGAYRQFLRPSRHPMAQGADICCDSAHKTLPVLTGGAYLHVGKGAPAVFGRRAQEAMGLFGSTSPSYLIMGSLDRANQYLAEGYPHRLAATVGEITRVKEGLARQGWGLAGDEEMKITLSTRERGYTGQEAAACLQRQGLVCEYADPDYLVLMPTPETPPQAFARLEEALAALPGKPPLAGGPPPFQQPEQAMPLRQALFAPTETLPPHRAVGRVAAWAAVSCPPAVAPVAPGERVSANAAAACAYYGITALNVVAEA